MRASQQAVHFHAVVATEEAAPVAVLGLPLKTIRFRSFHLHELSTMNKDTDCLVGCVAVVVEALEEAAARVHCSSLPVPSSERSRCAGGEQPQTCLLL